MKLKQLAAVAALAGAAAFGPAAHAVGVLTFDPSATNVGATNVGGGAAGALGTKAAFDLDQATLTYAGKLDVALSRANSIGGGFGGGSTWAESANIKLTQFSLGGVEIDPLVTGLNKSLASGEYDLYATFLATGTGIWLSNSNFTVASITNITVKFYASPMGATLETLGDPTNGTDATGGVTIPLDNVLLGVSTYVNDGTALGSASGLAGGRGSTSLTATLDFTPSAGTTGATGFFQGPDPFVIAIGSQAGGNTLNTSVSTNGAGVRWTTQNANRGGGSLTFAVVPEPGALALVGLALAAAGIASRRKSKTA